MKQRRLVEYFNFLRKSYILEMGMSGSGDPKDKERRVTTRRTGTSLRLDLKADLSQPAVPEDRTTFMWSGRRVFGKAYEVMPARGHEFRVNTPKAVEYFLSVITVFPEHDLGIGQQRTHPDRQEGHSTGLCDRVCGIRRARGHSRGERLS